jgi:hypothetical protein
LLNRVGNESDMSTSKAIEEGRLETLEMMRDVCRRVVSLRIHGRLCGVEIFDELRDKAVMALAHDEFFNAAVLSTLPPPQNPQPGVCY